MSAGQMSGGYALNSAKQAAIRPVRKVKRKEMKLSWKQRFRNWLNDSDTERDMPQIAVSDDKLSSEGMRLHVYKASGGFVIETRKYDHKTDRHQTTLHVITEEEDLGERMSKIVMMEALRG